MKIRKHVIVVDKIATYDKTNEGVIVCGNSNYEIEFTFDAEWDDYLTKKAKFKGYRNGEYQSVNVEFTGNICPVPPVFNTNVLEVGVFIDGGIRTTTSAEIKCRKCILCKASKDVLSFEEIEGINAALKGQPGDDGKSAYELAVQNGYAGTEEQWLASLVGAPGTPGKSAYEIAVEHGFKGTEEEWLASLEANIREENGNINLPDQTKAGNVPTDDQAVSKRYLEKNYPPVIENTTARAGVYTQLSDKDGGGQKLIYVSKGASNGLIPLRDVNGQIIAPDQTTYPPELDQYISKRCADNAYTPKLTNNTSVFRLIGVGTDNNYYTKGASSTATGSDVVPLRTPTGQIAAPNQETYPPSDDQFISKRYLAGVTGDIESALDSIIAIQESILGGNA